MTTPTLALLHGYLGFSHYGPIAYFRGVEQALGRVNIFPLITEVPPTGFVAERAEALAHQLFQNDAPAFALVAHSMGGLDARHLITHLDPDRRIKSLLTVATPHRGTPLASWFLESREFLPALIRRIGMPGLRELTPEARESLPIPDREDVVYSSYAGHRSLEELPFWLRHYGRVITEDNDGLVPVSSAKWGEFRGVMHTDHFEFVGWSLGLPNASTARPFDHLSFWVKVSMEAMDMARQSQPLVC